MKNFYIFSGKKWRKEEVLNAFLERRYDGNLSSDLWQIGPHLFTTASQTDIQTDRQIDRQISRFSHVKNCGIFSHSTALSLRVGWFSHSPVLSIRVGWFSHIPALSIRVGWFFYSPALINWFLHNTVLSIRLNGFVHHPVLSINVGWFNEFTNSSLRLFYWCTAQRYCGNGNYKSC